MKETRIQPYIKQFYRGNRAAFCFSIVHVVLESAGVLLVSWLLKEILDLIGGCTGRYSLSDLTLIALLCVSGISLSSFIAYHFKPRFITRGITQYKEYVFKELTRKNISAFSGESASCYLSQLTNDIQTIEQGYLRNVFTFIQSILPAIGAVVLMLIYSPLLTFAAVGFSLLPLAASLLTGNLVAGAERKVSDLNGEYTALIKDSLGGFSVIKSFKAEKQIIRIFREKLREFSKAQCTRQKMTILIQAFSTIAGIAAQFGVFIFGAYLALSGKGVTAGTTLIFVQLMNYILEPIGIVPVCIAERKAARALIEKTANALSENIRETGKSEYRPLEKGITVQNLSFAYEEGKPVLKNISAQFELGKKYAVVGASGSGKSTLLNLLMASFPDYDGEILYDNMEQRKISAQHLYEIQSIIQQNVFVFNATIQDNITMFSDFPKDRVEKAIRLSGLSSVIDEKGAGYLCGENGNGLSGGEKPRISIARSLIKNSQVLLVDEATASLDSETAFQVSCAILDLKNVTAVVVTHALDENLLKRYDSILTLKNGAVVEEGTFDELISNKGYFYSLFTVSQ